MWLLQYGTNMASYALTQTLDSNQANLFSAVPKLTAVSLHMAYLLPRIQASFPTSYQNPTCSQLPQPRIHTSH